MRRHNLRRAVGLLTLFGFMTGHGSAHAYNSLTHQNIVNIAWQSIRAVTARDLLAKIRWSAPAGTAATAPAGAPDLTQVGDCALPGNDPKNLCGREVTQDQWAAYLADLRLAMPRINAYDPAVSSAPACSPEWKANKQVGGFLLPPGPDHMPKEQDHCQTRGGLREGIFDFVLGEDGTFAQGAILGWHSKHRDDDRSDTTVDMAIPIVAHIVALVDNAFLLVLSAVFLPFVCLFAWFSGDSCEPADASRLADKVNPVSVIRGLIPGFKNGDASDEAITIWHFINVQSGNSNWYDDLQGMFYEEAGPNQNLSAVDKAIMLAGDLAQLRIDSFESLGAERYEITAEETPFANPSRDRADWSWQSHTLGHTAFSPLDNFALYGDQRLQKDLGRQRFTLEPIGWPLHAIGDANSPMHVVATTGWGHRPFEDYVDKNWARLMFEQCQSRNCDRNDLLVEQLKQTIRILQRGFRWREFMGSHPDLRDFITQIAKETLSRVGIGLAPRSVWCDACSAGYLDAHEGGIKSLAVDAYLDDENRLNYREPEQYYSLERNPHLFDLERELLERAIGQSLAYLLKLSDGAPNICTPIGASCTPVSSGDSTCCGEGPRGGQQAICGAQSKCCHPSRGVGQVSCNDDGECCTGRCGEGFCCDHVPLRQGCVQNKDCCGGICESGLCLLGPGASCQAKSDCTSNQDCVAGKCTGANGTGCTSGAECASGLCQAGICRGGLGTSCLLNEACADGLECVRSTCLVPTGGPCTRADDCASGVCDATGHCFVPPPA